MYRATVRFSINAETKGITNAHVRKILESAGFLPAGTATWELPSATLSQANAAVTAALGALQAATGGGHMDHVWVYVCKA